MGGFDMELIQLISVIFFGFYVIKFFLNYFYNHVISELRLGFVDFKYLGKWAVVTGATDGLGKAYAECLAKEGMDIVLISRSQSKLDKVAEEIELLYGVNTKTLAIDFTGDEEIYHTIEKNLQDLEIGVLVNNVGISYPHPEYFLQVKDDKLFSNILRCNCLSVVNMCKIVLPSMCERKRGAIINVSSMAAQIPNPLLTVYAASKSFVEKFTIDLRTEYNDKGLTIQCILPGYVATKMSKIRKATWMSPTPMTYVTEALRSLGIANHTTGYFPHTLTFRLIKFIEDVSPTVANMFVKNTLLSIRKRALAQEEKKGT